MYQELLPRSYTLHSDLLPDDLARYAQIEGVDADLLQSDIERMQDEQKVPLWTYAQRLGARFDQAVPALWWTGINLVEGIPGVHHEIKNGKTLFDLDSHVRTKKEALGFFGEVLTPISHSSLQIMIENLRANPSKKAQTLVPLIEDYYLSSEQSLTDLLDNIARIKVSGIALHSLFPIVAHSEPEIALGAAGSAIPLAQYHANAIASAYDTMNYYLRAGIHNGAILEFEGLCALGVPISEAISHFTQRTARGESLLRIYPSVISRRANSNSEAGFALGAVATSLLGSVNPFLFGIMGNRIKNVLGTAAKKMRHNNSSDFSQWFNAAQGEVHDLAEQAIFAEDPSSYIGQIKRKSKAMAQYIKTHSNIPHLQAQHRFQWIVQFITELASSRSFDALLGGVMMGTVGVEPVMAMTKLQYDQAAIDAQRVTADQAYRALSDQHDTDASVYKRAGERFKKISTSVNGIDIEKFKESRVLEVSKIIFHNGSERDASLALHPGYNFFVGESGSGKSTAVEHLMTTCDILDIPYSYSPVKMLNYMSSGLYIAKTIGAIADPYTHSHFGQYVSKKQLPRGVQMDAQGFSKAVRGWQNEWLEIQAKKRDGVVSVFEDPRWSGESRVLNAYLVGYLREVYQIHNPEDVLVTNGSEGQRKRIEICSSLQDDQARFIFIDESFAHLDPALSAELVTQFHSVLCERGSPVSVVIVSHQPQTVHQFLQVNTTSPAGDATLTRFKTDQTPTTQKFEQKNTTLADVVEILGGFISLTVQSDILELLQILNSPDDLEGETLKEAIRDKTIVIQESYSNLSEIDKLALQPFLTQATLRFIDRLLHVPLTTQQRYLIYIAFKVEVLDVLKIDNSEINSLVERVFCFFPNIEFDFMDNEIPTSLTGIAQAPKDEFDMERILEQVEYFRAGTLHYQAQHIVEIINNESDPELEEKLLEAIEFLVLFYQPGKDTAFTTALNAAVNAVITGRISDSLRGVIVATISDTIDENFQGQISDEVLAIIKKLSSVLAGPIDDWTNTPRSYKLPE